MSVIHEKNEDSIVVDGGKDNELPPMSPKEAPVFESHQEINITAIEAETLLLSMQATHRLL